MKKIIVIVGVLLLAALAGFFVFQNFRVSLKTDTYTVNINSDTKDIDVTKLLKGDEKLIKKATLDASKVSTSKIGDYKATIKCNGKTFQITIRVEDQTPPVLTLYTATTSSPSNQEILPEDVIKSVEDDTDCKTGFNEDVDSKDPVTSMKDSVQFDAEGTYEVLVVAVDDAGNYAVEPLTIQIVDDKTPPVFANVTAQVIEVGGSLDSLFASVTATDDTDGDVTSKIQIDTSAVDVNTAGTYTVTLTVMDGSKNTATATADVTVTDPNAVLNSGADVTIPADTDFTEYSTEAVPYGFGTEVDENNRPTGCSWYETKFGKYAADFIQPLSNNVYLTFDEGYEYGNTPAILDTLKEKGVKATFFVTLPFAKDNPDLIQRMIDEGHVIGNHTVTHPSDGLQSLSVADQISEIQTVHQYMLDTYHYEMYLFRFPTGKFSEQSLAIVQSLGYRSVFWSFAHYDWNVNDQPDVTESLNKAVASLHGGEIFLLHGVSTTDTAILGDLIDAIKEKGLQVGYYSRTDQ